MRHRVSLVLGLLVAAVSGPPAAIAADHPVAPPSELYGSELPTGQVLPIRGIDLPVDVSTAGTNGAYALTPQVQAIPTATAFQAGAFALAVIFSLQMWSRRRRKRSTAT